MAEFARWQWDDVGTWRDFAEQYQQEMEAAYHRQARHVELEIPPFGIFKMDIRNMKQITIRGRNPGYMRDIRRLARRIEVEYFLLGYDGAVCSSDSPLDQIEEEEVLETLITILQRICDEPEEFSHRSINLLEDDYRDTVDENEDALDFLCDSGFEIIEEGNARFLVFMQEDTTILRGALNETKVRLERVQKELAQLEGTFTFGPGAAIFDNVPADENNVIGKNPDSGIDAEGTTGSGDMARFGIDVDDEGDTGTRRWRVKERPHEGPRVKDENEPTPESGPLRLRLRFPTGACRQVELPEATLVDLLEAAKGATDLRLPMLRSEKGGSLALGIQPGVTLRECAGLRSGDGVLVQNFESAFVDGLQTGLLSLKDLALVAPLLDWDKPELSKLLMGRMRSLLEGSCDEWCRAAACDPETEAVHGRALLAWRYAGAPLAQRLQVCRQLLPTEKRDEKTRLRVRREELLPSVLCHLERLQPRQLRRQFAVEFVGEVAEDHGGPRRDFFQSFGRRLVTDLPMLWQRMPMGVIVPVADIVAETSPKAARCGVEEVSGVFRAIGRGFGLAAKNGDVVGEELAGFFIHQVARDNTVGLKELQRQLCEASGPDIRGSEAVLKNKLEDIGLQGMTLSRTITGTMTEVEFVPGGKDLAVTEDNKEEWLQLHLKNKLYDCLQKAADAFRQGLLDVFGGSQKTCPLFGLLSPQELGELWAGGRVTDEALRKWRDVAVVSEKVSQQANWFWEELQDAEEDFRAQILKFATGAPRISVQGVSNFEIQPADGGDDALPCAMTCANMLQLPRYSSREVLGSKLRKAAELCDGFQTL